MLKENKVRLFALVTFFVILVLMASSFIDYGFDGILNSAQSSTSIKNRNSESKKPEKDLSELEALTNQTCDQDEVYDDFGESHTVTFCY